MCYCIYIFNVMSMNKGWYMRFLCIHRGGQRNRLWGLFNSQRVRDCTLLLSTAASLLQALAFYFRMPPGFYKIPRPLLVAVVGI